MTVGQVTFKVLPLLLLFYMNYAPITCQNCGLPRILKVSDQLNESVDTGQTILAPLYAHNVIGVKTKTNPGNFSEIKFSPKTDSTAGKLSLVVKTPLWEPELSKKKMSFIDEHRLNEINVTLELECSDGFNKDILIVIPIRDENTAMPTFLEEQYNLVTEPCLLDRCTLIFKTDIVVTDQDIDHNNAKINVWTNEPKMINVLHIFSSLEHWYEDDHVEGLKRKGFQTRVKLEYLPADKFKQSITFSLYANNTVMPKDNSSGIYVATSNVTINFTENSHRLLPPVFANSLYYAYVKSDGKQIYTRPSNIYAVVPGGNSNETLIEYDIEGDPRLISIDGEGNLALIQDIGVMPRLINSTQEYKVTAIRTPEINASVPLILFLDSTCECDTTPWPGICPWPPQCPDPDPPQCPEPSTELPITVEPSLPTSEFPITTTELPEYTSDFTEHTTQAEDITSTTTDTPTSDLPTIPPDKCQCNCTEFLCSDPHIPPSLNSTKYNFYPDPYSCTKYHKCPNLHEGPEDEKDKFTFECPAETVFCPKMTAYTTVEMCLERSLENWSVIRGGYGGGDAGEGEGGGSGEEECQACQCSAGFPPGHPNNLCNSENYNQLIPDPKYCDVFHKCQEMGYGSQYIDYPTRCPPGLKFCPQKKVCSYHDDKDCGDSCKNGMIFKQCDVCEMGKWEGFDISNKKFGYFSVSSY